MEQNTLPASKTVKWVKFTNNAGTLKRIVFPSGKSGLLLQFNSTISGEQLRKAALDFGFIELKNKRGAFYKPPSPSRFNANVFARQLGGEVFDIPRATLISSSWTLDYTLEEIGRNFLGEIIYRVESGQRGKRVMDKEGHPLLKLESKKSNPPEFMRASIPDHLPQIAAGLLKMAEHGTVGQDALITVSKGASEPFDSNDSCIDYQVAKKILRIELLKQLVAVVVEDGGSRENYHRAMKLAERAEDAVREIEDLKGLTPTPGFLVFLRRLTLDVQEIEFSGNARLELAAPALRNTDKVSHQLLDLTVTSCGGAAERAANALANRESKGSSILLVEGFANGENAAAVRQTIGRAYALEIVAEISQTVAIGRHAGDPVTAFIAGERRPRQEESLPEAAQRTFKVEVWSDLDKLHTELLRNRRRIADWHREIADGVADKIEDEENSRQRLYIPLSQVTPSATMIPKSLEGATAKALRRTSAEYDSKGGVDTFVAESLGISADALGTVLSSEQVDAYAMRTLAAKQSRGFLLADQTGVGKGRSLAAMAGQHLKKGGNVLYFTENAEINIPDVWRDFLAVGAFQEAVPCILASRPVQLTAPRGENEDDIIYKTESAAERKRIYHSQVWPAGKNLVITNYSQFNGPETRPSRQWAKFAPDKNTLLILDESHNAINKKSNTGNAIRSIICRVGNKNVIYSTATPMRDPSGADLYSPLLPPELKKKSEAILENVAAGGETAQECFTTMLAEDGVFLRRDHSLSNIEFLVRLPDDARIAQYQNMMTLFAPLSELMLGAALQVGALVGRSQDLHYQLMLQEGMDERAARAHTNSMFQHSAVAGSPLANLARLTINAIKVNQVVEETMNEIKEGRKPQITFHSTYGSLLSESIINGGQEMEIPLNFRNQVERVAEQIFNVLMGGERSDARELDPAIALAHSQIQQKIDELPEYLPASPLDAVIEGVEAKGLIVGEISGRSLAYRNGRIVRRINTNRRQVVQDYNNGKIDVLIFNRAGATGGSYHASPEFRDQRPRSLIEMETPLDIIKYIQAQGRSNRLGQVARPRIVSVMTGLIPEMRILQQRNRKLRAMGASIDGNRSHPLLLDNVPDFLNKVGDNAARHVLKSQPDLARKLGFANLVDDDAEDDLGFGSGIVDISVSSKSNTSSLANRILTRSLVLTAAEQTQLIDFITIEFEAIVEELESRNANPLKPKEFPGEIEVKGTMLFTGIGQEAPKDKDPSAFYTPLYISIGTHHINEDPISGDELLQLVNASLVTDGADGFASFADYVETRIPTAISHLVRPGTPIQEAIANPDLQPYMFIMRFSRLQKFVEILRSIKPGRILQIDEDSGSRDGQLRTIVKLTKPLKEHAMLPQSYKIRTVTPGHSRPETISVNQLLKYNIDNVRFLSGLELGRNVRHLRQFNQQAKTERRYPVQLLTGNLLEAIAAAKKYRLGAMSIYRESTGQLQRGVVIARKNVNLEAIPITIPTVRVANELLTKISIEGLQRDMYFRAICEAEKNSKWLFDLSIRQECLRRPACFLIRICHDFTSYIQTNFNSQSNGHLIHNQRFELPRDAKVLIEFLEPFESVIKDGAIILQTDGIHRKLLTQIYTAMRRQEQPEQSPSSG